MEHKKEKVILKRALESGRDGSKGKDCLGYKTGHWTSTDKPHPRCTPPVHIHNKRTNMILNTGSGPLGVAYQIGGLSDIYTTT